ncbi:hypothetical protein FDECE_1573 [Fusarium decemcellulare]|nr:hypothetical protein FDECE_1573 [Fusarium decemcellulare]
MTPLQENEIRLLRLSFGKDGSTPPDIAFQRVSLVDPDLPPFVSLSYVWGNLDDTLPLSVSGQTVAATRNLHAVLQCLASSDFDQLLWVDALCINQHDLDERAAQVALMGEIYSCASYVLAFLSPFSDPFDIGLGFIEQAAHDVELHYEPSLDPHISVNGLTASSEALRDSFIAFFATPWWTRVWTVQEFVLAKKVIFQCGKHQIDAQVVQQAFQNLVTHERKCCWVARRAANGSASGFLDTPSKANGGLTLYTATLRMNNLNTIVNNESFRVNDMLGIISLFRTRQCSDPRDRVFGLSGLRLSNGHVQDLVPTDYTISTTLLYTDLALAAIEKDKNLDVLSHVIHGPSARLQTGGLPSWVPDWDAIMNDAHHLIHQERIDLMRHFKASADMDIVWRLNESGSITTHGLQFAKIVATAPGYPPSPTSTPRGKALIDEWRRLVGLPLEPKALPSGESDESKREWAFQRSLCAGLCLRQWKEDSCNYSSAYNTWFEWFAHEDVTSIPEEVRENAREFDFLVQTASLGRCCFVTENGQLGFGPELAQAGDIVVIIPGGKVPYVFRLADSNSEEDGLLVYELMGDAFVDDAMLGEMIGRSGEKFEEMVII